MTNKFDDIRPYYDEEIPEAMSRMSESTFFAPLARYIFPDTDIEETRRKLLGCRTTADFQSQIMYILHQRIVSETIRNFTFSGLEYLNPDKAYLFVSNHRDIMLDSSLLELILYKNGFNTTEITFGSNLMSSSLVVDIGKSNKMFTVFRGGSMRDFYENSLHLSEYIRHTITEKKESIWIAQRNGRTKNGKDATDQGILKMFCMSEDCDLVRSLSELNIVPVSISYQIEPCIVGKVKENYITHTSGKYIKAPGEDLGSILSGVTDYKGDVNISICEPLTTEELATHSEGTSNTFYKGVCSVIDSKIRKGYKLFCNNYIAADLLLGCDTFASHYTEQEKEEFLYKFRSDIEKIKGDKKEIETIYLGIYANPIIS